MSAAPRLWPNSTIVCVAPGPTLTQADCDHVRGRARVIAVNDGVLMAQWADVLYSSDRGWWKRNHAKPFGGLRFSVGETPGMAESVRRCPDVHVLQHTGQDGLELKPSGLRTGRNSGYAAINLAVHLGARRIVLLGYTMGRVDGRPHFYPSGQLPMHSPYAEFVKCFRTIVRPLQDAGVEIINCTPKSNLSMFPITDLREVIDAEVAA